MTIKNRKTENDNYETEVIWKGTNLKKKQLTKDNSETNKLKTDKSWKGKSEIWQFGKRTNLTRDNSEKETTEKDESTKTTLWKRTNFEKDKAEKGHIWKGTIWKRAIRKRTNLKMGKSEKTKQNWKRTILKNEKVWKRQLCKWKHLFLFKSEKGQVCQGRNRKRASMQRKKLVRTILKRTNLKTKTNSETDLDGQLWSTRSGQPGLVNQVRSKSRPGGVVLGRFSYIPGCAR